jgi:hypothetical protein
MAHPHLSETRATFAARIHRTKNRLVAVPAEVQRALGLERRRENHLLLVSIRPAGKGRWNHHYVKLTSDNEFAIPSDVAGLSGGDEIDVKVHRVIRDVEAPSPGVRPSGAGLLVALAAEPRAEWREEGSTDVDERLREEIRGPDRPR